MTRETTHQPEAMQKAEGLGATEGFCLEFPIDRTAALVRGGWRLVAAGVVGGPLLVFRPDWRLLWLTEPASFVALGVVMGAVLVLACGLAAAAARWVVLACWLWEIGIRIGPRGVILRCGPLGSAAYPWEALRIELDPTMDVDMADAAPDEALGVRLTARATGEDVSEKILELCRMTREEFSRSMAPVARSRLRGP
jgi:hypothetical protein